MVCSRCGKSSPQCRNWKANGRELSLCPACYEKLSVQPDFLSSLLGDAGKPEGAACPTCGMTLKEFRKTGLLGCADCYTTFRDELSLTLKRVQGGTRHVGKRPEGEEKHPLFLEQERLKKEMEHALKEGNYTLAQTLKARLVEINHKLYSGTLS